MIAPLEMRRLAYVGYVVVAGRKHSQDVLHGDAQVTNDGLAAEHVGAHGYPSYQVSISRHVLLSGFVLRQVRI